MSTFNLNPDFPAYWQKVTADSKLAFQLPTEPRAIALFSLITADVGNLIVARSCDKVLAACGLKFNVEWIMLHTVLCNAPITTHISIAFLDGTLQRMWLESEKEGSNFYELDPDVDSEAFYELFLYPTIREYARLNPRAFIKLPTQPAA